MDKKTPNLRLNLQIPLGPFYRVNGGFQFGGCLCNQVPSIWFAVGCIVNCKVDVKLFWTCWYNQLSWFTKCFQVVRQSQARIPNVCFDTPNVYIQCLNHEQRCQCSGTLVALLALRIWMVDRNGGDFLLTRSNMWWCWTKVETLKLAKFWLFMSEGHLRWIKMAKWLINRFEWCQWFVYFFCWNNLLW